MNLLLVPTFNGRQTLKDCLSSIRPHAVHFDCIVVSCNCYRVDFEAVSVLSSYLGSSHSEKLFVYCTGRLVSAVEHLVFMCKNISRFHDRSERIFLLADDDLISQNCDLGAYIRLFQKYPDSIGFPKLNFFSETEGSLPGLTNFFVDGAVMQQSLFLERNPHKNVSMSGICVPFAVLFDVARHMLLFRSSGYMFEYMMATHRRIDNLVSTKDVIINIRLHADQESAKSNFDQFLFDNFVCLVWVYINQPAARLLSLPLTSVSKNIAYNLFIRNVIISAKRKLVHLKNCVVRLCRSIAAFHSERKP